MGPRLLFPSGLLAAFVLVLLLGPAPASAATCSDYSNQRDAQRAKDTRDADGDGVYCESLPCPCQRPGQNSSKPKPKPRRPRPKPRPKPKPRASAYAATAVRAVDGDTIEARFRGRTEKVRLLGIDTPERLAARSGSEECGGAEASEYARRLVSRYPRVTLRTDPTQDRRDRYGRLLAYVDVRGSAGGSYQARLLQAGWAKTYPYGSRRFARYGQFGRSQARARAATIGVYEMCGGSFRRPLDSTEQDVDDVEPESFSPDFDYTSQR